MGIKMSGKKAKDDDFKYEVLEKCGVIGKRKAYSAELRYVKFGDNEPKYDLRSWKENEDGTETMTKGFSMTGEELYELYKILDKMVKAKGGK